MLISGLQSPVSNINTLLYIFRKRTDQMRQNYLKSSWHTPDCASCMMIETGEKASQPGLRCDSCGRFPRSMPA